MLAPHDRHAYPPPPHHHPQSPWGHQPIYEPRQYYQTHYPLAPGYTYYPPPAYSYHSQDGPPGPVSQSPEQSTVEVVHDAPIPRRESRTIRNKPAKDSKLGKPGFPDPIPEPPPRARFLDEHDEILIWLKEDQKLGWPQIQEFFPGRNSGTLQVRYCTKLKSKGNITWTTAMDNRLATLYKKANEQMWKSIASKMGPGIDAEAAKARWEVNEMKAKAIREAAERGEDIGPEATA